MEAGERSWYVRGMFSAVAVSKDILAMKNIMRTITTELNFTVIIFHPRSSNQTYCTCGVYRHKKSEL
jgi:hypothetical protein